MRSLIPLFPCQPIQRSSLSLAALWVFTGSLVYTMPYLNHSISLLFAPMHVARALDSPGWIKCHESLILQGFFFPHLDRVRTGNGRFFFFSTRADAPKGLGPPLEKVWVRFASCQRCSSFSQVRSTPALHISPNTYGCYIATYPTGPWLSVPTNPVDDE